jgi:hypothetical protein
MKGIYYSGIPLETGNTSISGNVSPIIKQVFQDIHSVSILDYGAGKYSRNSKYLRSIGNKVFSFDPFNFNSVVEWRGWDDYIANTIPPISFDIVFTSYVLNVVPKHIEREIIKTTEMFSDRIIHIVRNMDIFDMVKKNINNPKNEVCKFANREYHSPIVSDEDILNLCEFGVQTSRGFQRITYLEEYGYKLIRDTHGYKYYEKVKNP